MTAKTEEFRRERLSPGRNPEISLQPEGIKLEIINSSDYQALFYTNDKNSNLHLIVAVNFCLDYSDVGTAQCVLWLLCGLWCESMILKACVMEKCKW